MVVISSEWNDGGGLRGIVCAHITQSSFFSLREKSKEVLKKKISRAPESERQEVITCP